MRIEAAEVERSAYAFHDSNAGQGGGGCSVGGGASPTAQQERRSSIGRPEWQGCGGCGPNSEAAEDSGCSTSVFDCEHFQFIDDEDEEGDEEVSCENVPATQAPTGTEAAQASRSSRRSPRDAGLDEQLSTTPTPPPQQQQQQTIGDEMGESESRAHAVRRQVSFDEPPSATPRKELRSVLKKGSAAQKRHKNRVTFDEAVTLYSDENEDVQLLALTTGPDIVYADVFYMFEPPIEYQDVPPFEPPAEYRDSDETPLDAAEPPLEQQENDVTPDAEEPTPAADEPAESTPDPDASLSDVAVSKETEGTESASDEPHPEGESSLESDQLFERFLEAEREFAVDEELNSVFHALETDFANDDKNGALDDNFFRKLISLLSSAEGESSSSASATSDYFSEPHFSSKLQADPAEDDDNSQTHSRTLSEADSDCSISSQDTIIVRFGEDENEPTSGESASLLFAKPDDVPDDGQPSSALPSTAAKSEGFDDVFAEVSEVSTSDERPRCPLSLKSNHVAQAVAKLEKANGESLSRQSSGEQSVNSGNSQDPPQDADDSTSSDSRSGEVEEEIRLDDIGYDEEDAEDYDEESFRGMAHNCNSKIRRIIKKNALQCTLFRGIEAKRRQQPGAKYPRPKSPLLSQESLVEKLKWLTTLDEQKDADGSQKFLSKPPDVILSTGGVPVIPHSASSEDDIGNQTAQGFQQAPFYQPRLLPPNSYYVRRDGFPPTHHPSLPRQRVAFAPQQMMHTLPHPQNRVVAQHPQVQWSSEQQRSMSSMTVPRNFRDWRIIQRITGNRGDGSRSPQVTADYVRCPNGNLQSAYPPDVGRPLTNADDLEQFVEKDSKRMDMIRKRYSVAEEEDDPTFGFARRPSVRGVQNRIQSNPSSDHAHGGGSTNKLDPYVVLFEEQLPPTLQQHPRYIPGEPARVWNNRDYNQSLQVYGGGVQGGRSQVPMHIHRASVALTELPTGNATIPYTHRKPQHPQDPRYHSYAESMYGSTRTLPTQGWNQALPPVSPPMLQVPPPHSNQDERGVPEGASSSPKISSDSLYHAPVPDAVIATGGPPHKEDGGIIYYSLNV